MPAHGFATPRNTFPNPRPWYPQKKQSDGNVMIPIPSHPNTAILPDANAKPNLSRIRAVMMAVAFEYVQFDPPETS
jgi:hypothetical protein